MTKQDRWENEQARIEQIRDGLGNPIEDRIQDIVIVLNLLGFRTIFSCEGHVDRASTYPWVLIEVPQSKAKRRVVRKMEDYLEEFYSDVNFSRDRDAMIMMVPHGIFGDFRIQGRGSEILDTLPKELLTPNVRESILFRYRTEMDLFLEFLKEKFFTLPD